MNENKKIAKIAQECLIDFIKNQEELGGYKINIRDFDHWLSGFITGLSVGNREISPKDMKEISDFVVNSLIAKSLGVTGTSKERIILKSF